MSLDFDSVTGHMHMETSDEYRRFAQECVALAEKAPDPRDRLRLLVMAQAWWEMADKKGPKNRRIGT
jgi:hypothetical protein